MVRFSDMLGGSGEPDDANAADSPYAALASDEADSQLEDESDEPDEAADADAVKEPVPVATFETPEAVLDRLTQYATSRAADQTQAEAEPQLEAEAEPQLEAEPDAELEAEPDNVLPPVGDDFLPKFEGLDRKPGRGRRRHP
ncbi:MAG: hypothetical protein QOG50_1861 [Actinomycetota bacterium]|jgi:hypothetical protein|nr:hypothetical protein [Actinomycetota bacterium]